MAYIITPPTFLREKETSATLLAVDGSVFAEFETLTARFKSTNSQREMDWHVSNINRESDTSITCDITPKLPANPDGEPTPGTLTITLSTGSKRDQTPLDFTVSVS